jgi:hypothetical protein
MINCYLYVFYYCKYLRNHHLLLSLQNNTLIVKIGNTFAESTPYLLKPKFNDPTTDRDLCSVGGVYGILIAPVLPDKHFYDVAFCLNVSFCSLHVRPNTHDMLFRPNFCPLFTNDS